MADVCAHMASQKINNVCRHCRQSCLEMVTFSLSRSHAKFTFSFLHQSFSVARTLTECPSLYHTHMIRNVFPLPETNSRVSRLGVDCPAGPKKLTEFVIVLSLWQSGCGLAKGRLTVRFSLWNGCEQQRESWFTKGKGDKAL